MELAVEEVRRVHRQTASVGLLLLTALRCAALRFCGLKGKTPALPPVFVSFVCVRSTSNSGCKHVHTNVCHSLDSWSTLGLTFAFSTAS